MVRAVGVPYRLLHSVMETAVSDRLIRFNPCQIPRAGKEDSPERTTATLDQVFTIAGNIPVRFRLLVLLGCFTSMRWGELAALTRRDLDMATGVISISRAVVELPDGSLFYGPPKTRAGIRSVTIPAAIMPDVRAHLDQFTGPETDSPIFTGSKGGVLRRSNFQENWVKVIDNAGTPGLHFHDLRHTGNTLAADSGANLRELMERMGHASTRAALIYLHKKAGRDKAIADALSEMIAKNRLGATEDDPEGIGHVTGTEDP